MPYNKVGLPQLCEDRKHAPQRCPLKTILDDLKKCDPNHNTYTLVDTGAGADNQSCAASVALTYEGLKTGQNLTFNDQPLDALVKYNAYALDLMPDNGVTLWQMEQYSRAQGKPFRLYATAIKGGFDPRCDPKITGPTVDPTMLMWIAHRGHAWLITDTATAKTLYNRNKSHIAGDCKCEWCLKPNGQ